MIIASHNHGVAGLMPVLVSNQSNKNIIRMTLVSTRHAENGQSKIFYKGIFITEMHTHARTHACMHAHNTEGTSKFKTTIAPNY